MITCREEGLNERSSRAALIFLSKKESNLTFGGGSYGGSYGIWSL